MQKGKSECAVVLCGDKKIPGVVHRGMNVASECVSPDDADDVMRYGMYFRRCLC